MIKKYRPTQVWKMARIFDLALKGQAPDLFPIAGYLAEAYWFVRTISRERSLDALVFCVAEDAEPKLAYPSIVDWLEGIVDKALQALRSRYFNHSPNGTSA